MAFGGRRLSGKCLLCVCVCKQNKNRILTSYICVLPNEFERSDGFGFALVNFSQHNLTEQRASTWKLHPPKLLREREKQRFSTTIADLALGLEELCSGMRAAPKQQQVGNA